MPKIKALIRIKNNETTEELETIAIIHDNILKYKDNDTTMIMNYNELKLIRENNEIRINYPFSLKKKTIGTIELKDLNQTIEVNIKTNKIKINNNDIEINYTIDNQNFIYQVEEIK